MDGQKTRTTPLANDARVCNRCQQEPRIPGQRWCRACRTSAQRERRARMRAEGREQGRAVAVQSSRLAPAVVKQICEDDPDVGKEMAGQLPDELADSRSMTVLPRAAINALARLRCAENE